MKSLHKHFFTFVISMFCFTELALAAKFVEQPTLVQNPNDAAPLVAILTFKSDEPVLTEVLINNGEKEWSLHFDKDKDPSKGLIIAGMKANKKHDFDIFITGEDGKKVKADKSYTYTTPPLPPIGYDFPKINVLKSNPEKMESGMTIFSLRHDLPGRTHLNSQAQRKFKTQWGMLLGLDEQGEVIWYFKNNVRISGVEHLSNGNLLFHLANSSTFEIDMAGNIINEWYAEKRIQGKSKNPKAIAVKGLATIHHQPHEMPNGNFLALSASPKLVKNFRTSEFDPNAPRKDTMVMGDKIVEFDKQGNVIWEWDSFDYLDTDRIGHGTFNWSYWHVRGFEKHMDWTHGNGVTYNPYDDSIIVSLRHLDAVISIDRKTKEIKWIFAPDVGWSEELRKKVLKPVGDNFRMAWHGHNPRISGPNSFIFYDNAPFQANAFEEPADVSTLFSRGVEYKVNEKDMTVEQVWASNYSIDEEGAVWKGNTFLDSF